MWNPSYSMPFHKALVSSEQEAMHFGGRNPVSEPRGHHWATVSPPRDSIWVKPGTLHPHLSCAGAGWHQLSSWIIIWVFWLGLAMHLCLMLSYLLPGAPSLPARFLPGALFSPAAPLSAWCAGAACSCWHLPLLQWLPKAAFSVLYQLLFFLRWV